MAPGSGNDVACRPLLTTATASLDRHAAGGYLHRLLITAASGDKQGLAPNLASVRGLAQREPG
jgi:hypothetical protein